MLSTPSEKICASPTARRRPSRMRRTIEIKIARFGLGQEVDIQIGRDRLDARFTKRCDNRDVNREIRQREHGRSRYRAARPQVAILLAQPHPGPSRAGLLDKHRSAAHMDLREMTVDERLDLCSIEDWRHRVTTRHEDGVQLLSFGTLTRPFYAPIRYRNEDPVMHQMIRLACAAVLAIAFAIAPSIATAQPIKQVKLTDKHVEGFIAAQQDMASVAEKMQGSASDKPDPKIEAELESIAKKHGFASFAEYDDVAGTISMVMAGIDPQNKSFTEPQVAIKKEIEEVTADKSIPEREKKQMLEELNEALKSAAPIQFPTNIEIVTKYYDKIDAVLQ
jgi:hypothetical protein